MPHDDAMLNEVWRHLSPLLWEHIHLIGRYDFSEPVIAGELRPLRGVED